MKDIYSLIQVIYSQAYCPSGLIAAVLVAGFALTKFGVTPWAYPGILIWLLILGAIANIWVFIRRVPRFKNGEIGVLFAPQGDDDVIKDIDYIEQEVVSKLKLSKYASLFVIKRLPKNRIIRDVETAKAVRQKSGCMLLIWGPYLKGRAQGKEYRGFQDGKLSFTYAIPAQDLHLEQVYQKDIGYGLANRKWMFASENELIERDFIVNNVVDVVRYIIGLCLLYFGNLSVGRDLLVEIIKNPSMGVWNAKAERSIAEFLQNIKIKIGWADIRAAHNLYETKVFSRGKLICDGKTLDDILKLTEISLANYPSAQAYLLRAIIFFLKEDIGKARHALAGLKKKEPTNPSSDYSLGFLYAYENNLERAERRYKRAIDATYNASSYFLFHLVEFPAAVLNLKPDRIGLHYVLGVLHKELVDKRLAEKHFVRFIEEAEKQKKSWGEWIEKAKNHLKQIAAFEKTKAPAAADVQHS